MMNYPGVLNADGEVMRKIQAALSNGKPVDGHAPGLTGAQRKQYAAAGITTDHECSTIEEGRSCIESGMLVIIREGSAAKDYERLKPLIKESPDMVMLCTDDCHPDDFVRGHINSIVKRALADGFDFWDVSRFMNKMVVKNRLTIFKNHGNSFRIHKNSFKNHKNIALD